MLWNMFGMNEGFGDSMWDKGMLLACSNMMQSKGIHQTRNNNRSVCPKQAQACCLRRPQVSWLKSSAEAVKVVRPAATRTISLNEQFAGEKLARMQSKDRAFWMLPLDHHVRNLFHLRVRHANKTWARTTNYEQRMRPQRCVQACHGE